MKRIAPEVERLMWLIAENPDQRAVTDFESRFPEFRADLAKHIAMVDGLKTAGKKVPAQEIPRFVPRYTTPPRRPNRSLYVAFAFVLGALAFGTYSATVMLVNPPRPTPKVTDVVLSPPKLPPVETQPVHREPINTNPVDLVPEKGVESVATPDPMDKVVDFKGQRAPLAAAITMVCKKAGIVCELAPGVPMDEVVLDYEGWSARDVLEDLGQKYGFSVFPQQEGAILIIPARKEDGPTRVRGDHKPTPTSDPGDGWGGRERPAKAEPDKSR
jgi:hypothetical protein